MAQHRTQRDQAKAQELQELRVENQQLRRKVTKLRRMVDRLQGVISPEEPDEQPDDVPKPKSAETKCESCGSPNVRDFTTPRGTKMRCCGSCQKRTPA